MPLQATSGAASYDAFGGGVPVVPNYIEEVFSTWLYTGTGSAQTITNGIDFSTKGGLLWLKARDDTRNNWLYDTTRSIANGLRSDSTAAATSTPDALTAFNSNGFSIGTSGNINTLGNTLVSWSFRKQPKFFDVLTYTGNGIDGRTISHNLGSVPGCIIVKTTNTTNEWAVYHRSLGATKYIWLNASDPEDISAGYWNDTNPTSTNFTVGSGGRTNGSGNTYVAYVFAHNAGGFGLTGTDNVISCGSYTGSDSTTTTVTLGYEPQWIMIKRATGDTSAYTGWAIFDNMRGMPVSGNDNTLLANTSDAENPVTANGAFVSPTATGFTLNVAGSNLTNTTNTYIYIAIRRGPMKVPTSGTSVFSPKTMTATQANLSITGVGFSPDLVINGVRSVANYGQQMADRLRGITKNLFTEYDFSEYTYSLTALKSLDMGGISLGTDAGDASGWNFATGDTSVKWMFKRAPSVFDIVCYTGTGSNTTFTHNLGVAPELIFVKRRDTTGAWDSYSSALANTEYIVLNTTAAKATGATRWNSTTPTASVFSVGTSTTTNASAGTYVAYLFATCAGVSKVGTYTGNGSTQTIDCGFGAGGARFVLIKRTDSTGDWYVYDTARGMTVLTDPYLRLNSAAVEVATLGSVITVSTGFALNSTILAAINASGGSYIFLAFA